jgi:protein-S-isoprenylcysteine O-methyltransferase Ste14
MIAIFLAMFIWACIHSVLAGQGVKQAIRHRFGERSYYGLYRLGYNVLATLTLAPILLWIYFGASQVVCTASSSLVPIFLAIQTVGLVGLVISLLQIDLGRFMGLSQLRAFLTGQPLPLAEEPLQTGGVYSLVRHPLYLFSLLVLWPMSTMTDTVLAFNLLASLYFLCGSLLEEQRLVVAFGQPYLEYKRRVPWLIPFLHWPR